MTYKFKTLGLLCSFVFFALAGADASINFRLEQSKVRLTIPAGGTHSGIIKLYSQAKNPIHLKVYAEDWAYESTNSGTKDFFPPKTHSNSCAGWIKFRPLDFILSVYGVQEINYSVDVPADAKGGYYAVLFYEGEASQEDLAEGGAVKPPPSNVTIAIRLGTIFYIDVKNTVAREAKFSNFSVSKGLKDLYSIRADLANTGNADITVGGNFYIMDKEGMVYGRGEFNDAYTFPGDTAQIKSEWKAQMPAGSYDVVMTFDFGKAFEETAGAKKGPIVTKEAKIEIDSDGEVKEVSQLKQHFGAQS